MGGRFAKVHPLFHISLLRSYIAGGDGKPIPEPVEVDDEPEYEVEKLVAHRRRARGLQFLVRWAGYDPSEDSWVDEADLANAPDILALYKSQNGLTWYLACLFIHCGHASGLSWV